MNARYVALMIALAPLAAIVSTSGCAWITGVSGDVGIESTADGAADQMDASIDGSTDAPKDVTPSE